MSTLSPMSSSSTFNEQYELTSSLPAMPPLPPVSDSHIALEQQHDSDGDGLEEIKINGKQPHPLRSKRTRSNSDYFTTRSLEYSLSSPSLLLRSPSEIIVESECEDDSEAGGGGQQQTRDRRRSGERERNRI